MLQNVSTVPQILTISESTSLDLVCYHDRRMSIVLDPQLYEEFVKEVHAYKNVAATCLASYSFSLQLEVIFFTLGKKI